MIVLTYKRGFAEYKVKGGKLIQCDVSMEGNVIKAVRYTGDFFMYPEDAIEMLERDITHINITEARNRINKFFEDNKIELFGVAVEDFIRVLDMAVENAMRANSASNER